VASTAGYRCGGLQVPEIAHSLLHDVAMKSQVTGAAWTGCDINSGASGAQKTIAARKNGLFIMGILDR
jgi:hypothetical protein